MDNIQTFGSSEINGIACMIIFERVELNRTTLVSV